MKTFFAAALLVVSTSAMANERCEHIANLAGVAYVNHITGFPVETVRQIIADNCQLDQETCKDAEGYADMVANIPRYRTWLWESIFNSVYGGCINAKH